MLKRKSWQEELQIVDRTMKAISGITDPEELVEAYFDNIGELLPPMEYVSVSRRNVEAPHYLVTRSSRFTEHPNPWTQRDRLPKLTGGILGEIAYANQPVIIDNLPARLTADDPGHFYLHGAQYLVALPTYDHGEGINVTAMLLPEDQAPDLSMVPIMHWQSGLFGRGTQNLVLRNQLATALGALDRELQAVGQIQKSLLPESLPDIPGFELAAFYQTSARAGGDYYDFFPLDDGGYGLFIADVSGHGTPAAVLMAITHAIAHAKPGTHTPPASLLKYLNDRLIRSYTRGGTFVTAFYAVLDPASRTLSYARAGHNAPRLRRRNSVISLDACGALPLGIMDEQEYEHATLTLAPDDMLLLYTDGITEAMSPPRDGHRELYGTERLDRVLLECDSIDADTCLKRIIESVNSFTANAPASDDQTLIAIRCV